MIQVNERSTAVLAMTFTDENKAAVVPTSARYQICDELSKTVLTSWTSFSPSTASYNLTIDQSNNQIIDTTRDVEVRVVTIVFEYNSGTKQCTGDFRYEVRNLFMVPVSIDLEVSAGAVIGGSCALSFV